MIRDSSGLRIFDTLSRTVGVVHGFATAETYSGFDGTREQDRERLRSAISEGQRFVTVATRQTHSARVARVRSENGAPCADREFDERGIDGLVTTEPGLLLHAMSADCPLLFVAMSDAQGVAIAHCGWRGTANGIVEETVARLLEATGGEPRQVAAAAISPGARGCCYEVGDEVIEAISRRGPSPAEFVVPFERIDGPRSNAVCLDRAIRSLLVSCGVLGSVVEAAAECTICGGSAFHSYRRSGARAGRSSGVIGLLARSR